MSRPRDPYITVCQAARDAIERAATSGLTVREHTTFDAVLHHTAFRSRLGDHIYAAHIARVAFGVDHAEPWQVEKTRKALARLRTLGVIAFEAGRGRPTAGATRAYWVGLPSPETQPDPGPHSDEISQPDPGPHYTRETQPDHGPTSGARNPARSRRKSSPIPRETAGEKRPRIGPPTEEDTEGDFRGAIGAAPPPKAGAPLPAQKARANGHHEHEHTEPDDFQLHPLYDAIRDQLGPIDNPLHPAITEALDIFEHLLAHTPIAIHPPLIADIRKRKLTPRQTYRAARELAADHGCTLPPLPTTKAQP